MRHWKMIAMLVAFALLVAGCGGNAEKKLLIWQQFMSKWRKAYRKCIRWMQTPC